MTTVDVERARFNMIEQQIRPWDVLDQTVLDLLPLVRREQFVPRHLRALAFADLELPLTIDGVATGETMLEPKVEARLLQELALRPHERVLEIGAGSGYMAALAAHKAQHVVSIEIDPLLQAFANANLGYAGILNVDIVGGDGLGGWPSAAPYDAIVVSGGLPEIPEVLRSQLKLGGRLVAIVGTGPVMNACLVRRVTDAAFETEVLFETHAKLLRNAPRPTTFRF